MIQIAQYISSRVQYKKRSRSGLRRGFLCCAIGEIDKSRCVSYFPTVPYYEAYEERFGVRKESAQGNPTISGILANYYTEGIYAIDVPSIDERDVAAFKEVLEIKNFWFTDELEREFEKVCIHSSDDAFNSAAFKRLGYTLNMGYAYNDIYSSVVNYFDAELFSSDIVDLNELDRRLVNLSIFNSALYKKNGLRIYRSGTPNFDVYFSGGICIWDYYK